MENDDIDSLRSLYYLWIDMHGASTCTHVPCSLSFTFSKEIECSHVITRRQGSKVIFARFLCPRGDVVASQVHDPVCCCFTHGAIVEQLARFENTVTFLPRLKVLALLEEKPGAVWVFDGQGTQTNVVCRASTETDFLLYYIYCIYTAKDQKTC